MPQAQLCASGRFQEVPGALIAENNPTHNSLPVEKHFTLLTVITCQTIWLREGLSFDCEQGKQ